jgi:hypothetical protein
MGHGVRRRCAMTPLRLLTFTPLPLARAEQRLVDSAITILIARDRVDGLTNILQLATQAVERMHAEKGGAR